MRIFYALILIGCWAEAKEFCRSFDGIGSLSMINKKLSFSTHKNSPEERNWIIEKMVLSQELRIKAYQGDFVEISGFLVTNENESSEANALSVRSIRRSADAVEQSRTKKALAVGQVEDCSKYK